MGFKKGIYFYSIPCDTEIAALRGKLKYIYKKRYVRVLIACLDRVGTALLGGFKQELKPGIRKILIFKPDHIGDVLLATPVFQRLKQMYPGAHITLIVGKWAYEIVENNPDLDEIVIFNSPWLARKGYEKSWVDLFTLIVRLRKERYDAYYCLRSDLLGNLTGFFSKIPVRSGFQSAGGGFFCTEVYSELAGWHQTEILLQVTGYRKKRESKKRVSPRIMLLEQDREVAQKLIWDNELSGKRLVGIHAGAGYPSKIWPLVRYGRLIRKIFLELGLLPVMFGGDEERMSAKKISSVIEQCEGFVVAGSTGLKLTAALIERCSLFIGNDSGPGHMAAAMGVPTVIIFSLANSPERWRPCGEKVSLVYKDVPCRECERSTCTDNRCLDMVSVEDVFLEAKRLLS